MDKLLNFIYFNSNDFIQNLMVTGFNFLSNKKKYSINFLKNLSKYIKNKNLSFNSLKEIQANKFEKLLKIAFSKSSFYNNQYKNIEGYYHISNIKKLPIITKKMLVENKTTISTISRGEAVISTTGGTTGASLEVLFDKADWCDRFAYLDFFRKNFGYSLGEKTAWFSGKNIITNNDIKKNRFWKTDFLNNVRYYSTFNITNDNLRYYLENILKFKPRFLVGFPSSINQIAKYGIINNIEFPKNTIKAIFPTSETLTKEIINNIESFFKTSVIDQYASAEGAPFIIQCKYGKMHLELQTGVFEVLDNDGNDVNHGRLIVTSFHSSGTPLIRYDIGDSIEISDLNNCKCGNNNPIIQKIYGRIDDYIFSEENGKIYLGNISNCTKNTSGILKFQIIQDKINYLEVFLEVDRASFNKNIEDVFKSNLIKRVGKSMNINISYVTHIDSEKSGKFRIIKNNIIK